MTSRLTEQEANTLVAIQQGSRVQQCQRLVWKSRPGGNPSGLTVCKGGPQTHSQAQIWTETPDFAKPAKLSAKEHGAWRYPGGVIVRGEHLKGMTKGNGEFYRDHRDLALAPRKNESNFFITLNTNRSTWGSDPAVIAAAQEACTHALKELSKPSEMCTYMRFGPKNAYYATDKFVDVIEAPKTAWDAAVEIGPTQGKLHCHVWLTLHHYSELQVNMPVIGQRFKYHYNQMYRSKTANMREADQRDLEITKKPYVNVKLLPQSNFAEVIRQYMLKGMHAST